ncbi:MAG: hypothetical protein C0627_10645 [Sulfurimonas sp.]|nr:MAG: hypothetical protein C0627_10645 [Sulfurimonas sp.]
MLTAKSQVDALQMIAVQFTKDFKQLIKGEANKISFEIFKDFEGIKTLPVDSKLWYLHHRLNEEYSFLSNELDLFKNVDDMEANYKAIILEKQMLNDEREKWLDSIGIYNIGSVLTYYVGEDSCNTKIKDNSSSLSLGIYNDISFLNKKFSALCDYLHGDFEWFIKNMKIHNMIQVKIVNFDRVKGFIAIKFTAYSEKIADALQELIKANILNLNEKLYILEINAFPGSYHTLQYIKAIKTPLISHAEDKTLRALGLTSDKKGTKSSPDTMAADILWNAGSLQKENSYLSTLNIDIAYKIATDSLDNKPNEKQEEAIYTTLNKKLSIIWGPPGTGKTNTASILIKTLLLLLQNNNLQKNILLTAFTYQACIELFEKIYSRLDARFEDIEFIVIKSKNRKEEFEDFITRSHSWKINLRIINDRKEEYPSFRDILRTNSSKIKVVIAPVAALNGFYNENLESGAPKKCQYKSIGKFFDFVLLDEASQCDVAKALGVLYGLKKEGQLVVLGDHLQMPPIHQVEPPLNIEHNVGSFLNYLRERHHVNPIMLNINYRSTKKIVDYIKTLGYDNLQSSKGKAKFNINHEDIIKNIYKDSLSNDDLLSNIIEVNNEVMSLTHYDDLSSQANPFEAEIVAAIIIEAYNKFYDGTNITEYDKLFWEKELGVVTPHKAQKVMISKLLYGTFPNSKRYIDNAIDTVERFQGSQRKFIIISFGVGDPDIISQEEDFLLNLNRTNVAISRAEEKVLVVISDKLIHHLPEDKEVMKTAKAIKSYVHQYCNTVHTYGITYEGNQKSINLRIHKSK